MGCEVWQVLSSPSLRDDGSIGGATDLLQTSLTGTLSLICSLGQLAHTHFVVT